jgi:ABC-type hemin transport system substrate-binding protein
MSAPALRPGSPQRIVSLVPSLTEALFAVGVGARVVGGTRFCEEPAAALAGLPRIGGTKNPDTAAIISLAPDLVVASREENRQEDVVALEAAGLHVAVADYPSVSGAMDGLIELTALVDGDLEIARGWQKRAVDASRIASSAPPVTYFCPIWRNPYMTARLDTYMADLLACAGGVPALAINGPLHYNAVALATAMGAQPDVILLPDEPYRFAARHRADFAPFTDVPAVRNDRIVLFDGKLLTWYGPRTPAALSFFADTFAHVRSDREVQAHG